MDVVRTILFSTALLASLALGFVIAVQPQAATVPNGFDPDRVAAVLVGLKVTGMKRETVDNDPRLSFKIGDTSYVADFYSCQGNTKCKLLEFAVAYVRDATDTIEAVNAYNAKYVYGKAAISKEDSLVSSRVMNGVAGWSEEQVAAEFGGFLGATDALLDHLKTYVVASAGPGVSGSYQNMSVSRPAAGSSPEAVMAAARAARLARLPTNRRH